MTDELKQIIAAIKAPHIKTWCALFYSQLTAFKTHSTGGIIKSVSYKRVSIMIGPVLI